MTWSEAEAEESESLQGLDNHIYWWCCECGCEHYQDEQNDTCPVCHLTPMERL